MLNKKFYTQTLPSVVELIYQNCIKKPDLPAVAYSENDYMSYQDLISLAICISEMISQCKIKQRSVIAISGDDNFELIAAIIASWMSNMTVLTVDPKLPRNYVNDIFSEADVKLLLYTSNSIDWIDLIKSKSVKLHDFLGSNYSDKNIEITISNIDVNTPAYIVFTSGTTGKPKGIIGKHNSLSHFLLWQKTEFNISEKDRSALLTSLSFDVVFRAIFVPLISGSTLYLRKNKFTSQQDILSWLLKNKICFFNIVPTLGHDLVNAADKIKLPCLNRVFFAGEPLLESLIRGWRKAFPNCLDIINLYGPSETTLAKSFYRVPAETIRGSQPIGRPIPGAEFYILDKDNTPSRRVNYEGEIVIRTPYRSFGYLNYPNKEFINNKYNNDNDDLLYFTGDLGKINDNGDFEILGRQDNQVKINGVRIELCYIEENIKSIIGVNLVAVVVSKGDLKPLLVAYYTTRIGSYIDSKVIKEQLIEMIPLEQMPRKIIHLNKMPKTSTGKIDRFKLLTEHQDKPDLPVSSLRNYHENIIIDFFCKTLKYDKISVDTNFFEFGGDSLDAINLSIKLSEYFKCKICQKDIFINPTVYELSKYVQLLELNKSASQNLPISKVNRNLAIELTPQQKSIYIIEETSGHGYAYNQLIVLKSKSKLNVDVLNKTINQIISNHDIFNLRIYRDISGRLIQEYKKTNVKLKFKVKEEVLQKAIDSELSKPFDFLKQPLIRCSYIYDYLNKCYYLVMTTHHIVFDGISRNIFIEEFEFIYNEYIEKDCQGSSREISSYDFLDYVENLNLNIINNIFKREIKFWENHLKDNKTIDWPKEYSEDKTNNISIIKILDKKTVDAVNVLSKSMSTTDFTIYLAIYYITLSYFLDSRDLLIGVPFSNRDNKQTYKVLGYFANTMPIRNSIHMNKNFNEIITDLKELLLLCIDNNEIPFELIENSYKNVNLASSTHLLEIMFVYNESSYNPKLGNSYLERVHIESKFSKFNILLEIFPKRDSHDLVVEYNNSIFSSFTIKSFINLFCSLLNNCVNDITSPIEVIIENITSGNFYNKYNLSSDNPLPEADLIDILSYTNNFYDIKDNALKDPYSNSYISYKKLIHQADCISKSLINSGIKKGDVIALVCDRGPNMLYAFLGILRIGAVYLPVNIMYPKERIQYIVNDSEAKIILVDKDNVNITNKLDYCKSKILTFEEMESNPIIMSNNILEKVSINDPAYIIYTSGTTGSPKGILQTHKTLVNLATWQVKQLGKYYNVAQFSSFGFDVSIQELVFSLYSKSCIIFCNEDIKKDPYEVVKFINRNNINVLFLPTAYLHYLSRTSNIDKSSINCLLYVIVAGETLRLNKKDISFFDKLNNCLLINQYGPSETHVVSSEVLPKSIKNWVSIPCIGKSISNIKMYVVDSRLNILPPGFKGQLCITGHGLAIKYLNKPNKTNEKFVHIKIGNETIRAYLTGDICRINQNNKFEIYGRNDSQVKLRGYLIEPKEIEVALCKCDDILDAVVIVKKIHMRKSLIAFYVTKNNIILNTLHIMDNLKKSLPDYMIPSLYKQVPSIPTTFNGKVNYKSLYDDNKYTYYDSRNYVAPQTKAEIYLCNLIKNILKVDKASVFDNFFELGGTSILLFDIKTSIEKYYFINIPLIKLYKNPQVYYLGKFIDEMTNKNNYSITENKTINLQENDADIFPLTNQQEQIWIIEKLSTSKSYNISHAMKICGDFNMDILNKSIQTLSSYQELMSCKIIEAKGNPFFKKFRFNENNLELISVKNEELDEKLTFLSNIKFCFENDFLIRFYLLSSDLKTSYFLVVVHHIIADAKSINLLINQLFTIYNYYFDGRILHLNKPSTQYRDYAIWQKNNKSDDKKIDRRYWSSRLANAEFNTGLPTDYLPKNTANYDGKEYSVILESSLSLKIEELSNSLKGTTFNIFLSCLNILIYYYTNKKDITIGTAANNRPSGQLDETIGHFIQTIVLRNQLRPKESFESFYQEVQENTISDLSHCSITLFEILKSIDYKRDITTNPLFDTMIIMHEDIESKVQLIRTSCESVPVSNTYSSFNMTIYIIKRSGRYHLSIKYKTSLYKDSTMSNYINHYLNILEIVCDNPNVLLAKICPLTELERRNILYNFNNTDIDIDIDCGINKLFEIQAHKTPNRIAVIDRNQQLSYRELNSKANQVANHLINLKIKIETPVVILLERSTEFIISMIGILKTGAAYIPIESNEPIKRIKAIFNDASVKYIISNNRYFHKIKDYKSYRIDIETIFNHNNFDNPNKKISSNNLAYIIYTSGSTGKPKGVMIEHKSLLNYLLWAINYYDISSKDTAPLISSPSFDMSVTSIFPFLLSGGSIKIFNKGDELEIDSYFLSQTKPYDLLKITPAHLHALSKIIPAKKAKSISKKFVIGGEQLNAKVLEFWKDNSPSSRYINEYGPTEATVGCCVYDASNECSNSSIPIGKPIANTRLYVLNESLQPVPIGVRGELYISGKCLSRGYYNNKLLTNKKFITSPFNSKEKLYRTGDMVLWMDDGNLKYIQRIDDQIKLRGYRIDLDELWYAILQVEGIENCALVKNTINDNNEILICYLVTKQAPKPTTSYIKNQLANYIPEYMMPAIFCYVDDIPVVESGKVDKKSLPIPSSLNFSRNNFTPPQKPNEIIVAKIWEEILGLNNISIDQNFFDIGGDSLLAVHLIYKLNGTFNAGLKPSSLYKHNTIEDISKLILNDNYNDTVNPLVNMQPKGNKLPIYFIHSAGGHVFNFINLSNSMGDTRPFFALQNIYLYKPYKYKFTIDELSEIYLKQIKKTQPSGPYIICGWSFGGVVAFDICHKLINQNESIDTLILLDTYLPCTGKIKKLLSDDELLSVATNNGQIKSIENENNFDIVSHVYLQSINALFEYDALTYKGDVLIIESIEADETYQISASETWIDILQGKLTVQKTPGNHHSMLNSNNVESIALIINKYFGKR